MYKVFNRDAEHQGKWGHARKAHHQRPPPWALGTCPTERDVLITSDLVPHKKMFGTTESMKETKTAAKQINNFRAPNKVKPLLKHYKAIKTKRNQDLRNGGKATRSPPCSARTS